MQLFQYSVYGYYSYADFGHPQYLETFKTREEAEECIKDFESVNGRSAWIENEPVWAHQ